MLLIIVLEDREGYSRVLLELFFCVILGWWGIDILYKNVSFDSIINDFLLTGRDLLSWANLLHLECPSV